MDRPSGRLLGSGERTLCRLLIVLGAAFLAWTFYKSPQRAWANILVDNFYFLSLSLAAVIIIAALYLTKAGWAVGFRRIPEAMTSYMPLGAIIVVASLFLGTKKIYYWASAAGRLDPLVLAKSSFLSWRAMIGTSIFCLIVWLWFSRRIVKNSRLQDEENGFPRTLSNTILSGAFMPVFALTYSVAAVYWIMSLEPHWYSTMYTWFVFGGMFVHGLAATALLLLWLKGKKFYPEIGPTHFYSLGELIFAFSIFWIYLWFSQYMLIWYENLPPEVTHFVLRTTDPWAKVFWSNIFVNFIIPFFILLGIPGKRNAKSLGIAAALIVLGHWMDVYLLVMPPLEKSGPVFGAPEILIFCGFAAVFLLIFERAFLKVKPYPVGDPLLQESLALHD